MGITARVPGLPNDISLIGKEVTMQTGLLDLADLTKINEWHLFASLFRKQAGHPL